VKLLGVGFETEGPSDSLNAMPVLIPECAELGNLAEILETARKEDRPLEFNDKITLCLDIAHGLEILHACGNHLHSFLPIILSRNEILKRLEFNFFYVARASETCSTEKFPRISLGI